MKRSVELLSRETRTDFQTASSCVYVWMIFTATNFDISSFMFCDAQVKIFHAGSTETIFRISATLQLSRLLTNSVTNRPWSLVYIQHDLCSLNSFSNSWYPASSSKRGYLNFEPGSEPGSEPGFEPGFEPGSEPRFEPRSELGSELGSEPGFKPGLELGS